jgi:hypothetical protein
MYLACIGRSGCALSGWVRAEFGFVAERQWQDGLLGLSAKRIDNFLVVGTYGEMH